MITINPVNFNNKKYVSFGEGNLNNITSSVGILSLQAPDAKREFAGNLYMTKKADAVQTNPAKAFVYKLVKAYIWLFNQNRKIKLATLNKFLSSANFSAD